MTINPCLSLHDPSKYTVYQMLEYTKEVRGIELIQELSGNLFLFRTEPFVDILYNYAHVLKDNLDKGDIKMIKEFFGKDLCKVKITDNPKLKDFLISEGFLSKSKDRGNIMVAENINWRKYEYSLPEGAKIVQVSDKKTFDDFKRIFSEAFDNTLEGTNRKLGFLEKIIFDNEDNHVNAFVLYENEIPAAAGSYYAFDNFSVENIGTKMEFRKKGYAHKIMNHLLSEAKRLGYEKACLVASESGARVYKDVGFQSLRETRTFVPKNIY